MMIKKIKFLAILFIGITLFSSFQLASNTDPKDKVLLTILRYVLTEGHYQPKEINDEFSEKVYYAFLDNLDPSKRYFIQSDIDEFSKYKYSIDDEIKNENLTFFFLVYNRFKERTNESKNYYKEILAKPFDFNTDEVLNVDSENATYAINKKELKDDWRKQLKASTIAILYDKLEAEETKKKEDSSYEMESISLLENEVRETVSNNLTEFYERFDELTYTDWFSTYINCITE
jgi:carboxyl-terminal processing protease